MKTAKDPRHRLRKETLKFLFAETFIHQESSNTLAKKVMSNRNEIDKLISNSASQWPIEKLNKIDLAVLRLAVYELKYTTR